MLDAATIARYQNGGDIYQTIYSQYGQSVANSVAQAAATGDRTQVTNALLAAQGYNASNLDSSEFDILAGQLYNNPLGAPLQQLQTVAGNTETDLNNLVAGQFFSFLGNPAFLIVAAAAVYFYVKHKK